jgi:hypothetical protein
MVALRVSPGHTISEKGHYRKSDRAMRGGACPSTADKRRLHRHVGFVTVGDVKLSHTITSPDRRLGHGSLFITSQRSASGTLQSRFQGAV